MTEETCTTLQHGGCTIVVHRPALSKEERTARERQVLTVMESTMKSYINRKEKQA